MTVVDSFELIRRAVADDDNALATPLKHHEPEVARGLQPQKGPQPADRIQPVAVRDASCSPLATLGAAATTPSSLAARKEWETRLHAFFAALPGDDADAICVHDLEEQPIANLRGRTCRAMEF